MNFNKIKIICEVKGISTPQLAEMIGLSEAGLYQSYRNQSMKVDILEKIAKVLEVPIWVFFDLDPESEVEPIKKERDQYMKTTMDQDVTITYLQNEVKVLTEMLEAAKRTNILQHKLIENQEKMLSNYEKQGDPEAMFLKINETLKVITGVVKGEIEIGSPEAQQIDLLHPGNSPIPNKNRKEKK